MAAWDVVVHTSTIGALAGLSTLAGYLDPKGTMPKAISVFSKIVCPDLEKA